MRRGRRRRAGRTRSTAASTALRTASSSVTSAGWTSTSAAPAARASAAASSSDSAPRATSTRRAPRPASSRAVARPMPLEAPVIRTAAARVGTRRHRRTAVGTGAAAPYPPAPRSYRWCAIPARPARPAASPDRSPPRGRAGGRAVPGPRSPPTAGRPASARPQRHQGVVPAAGRPHHLDAGRGRHVARPSLDHGDDAGAVDRRPPRVRPGARPAGPAGARSRRPGPATSRPAGSRRRSPRPRPAPSRPTSVPVARPGEP